MHKAGTGHRIAAYGVRPNGAHRAFAERLPPRKDPPPDNRHRTFMDWLGVV